jgi:hypothetical protein
MSKCLAKTRYGGQCQKLGMLNGRCRLHGGLSPKGVDHWNWQHGKCTKEQRKKSKATTAELGFLKALAMQLGMIQL